MKTKPTLRELEKQLLKNRLAYGVLRRKEERLDKEIQKRKLAKWHGKVLCHDHRILKYSELIKIGADGSIDRICFSAQTIKFNMRDRNVGNRVFKMWEKQIKRGLMKFVPLATWNTALNICAQRLCAQLKQNQIKQG